MTEQKFNSLFLVFLAALLGLGVMYLSWLRFQASFHFLPVSIAIERYHESREIPTHRMLTLIGFAQQAISHHDHYRYHDGLSFLHYLRALDIHTPALDRRGEYRHAEAQAVEVVRRAPAQPEAWLRIAVVRSILRDEPERVLEPWRMSIFTGRTHSTLLVPRASIGLPYADIMDAESRAMLRDQLLLAWAGKPDELLRELKQLDPGLEKTGTLVGARDPAALAEMEVRIEKIR